MARVAVAAIHGISSDMIAEFILPMMEEMKARVSARLRQTGKDPDDVDWQIIYWQDISDQNELRYLEELDKNASLSNYTRLLRKAVVTILADATTYLYDQEAPDSTYRKIHNRVREKMAELAGHAGGDTPLVVVAHSLGALIMSDYIWNIQQNNADSPDQAGMTPLEKFQTLRRMMTIGCNIPLFTMAVDDPLPITVDGRNGGSPQPGNEKPWQNFFSPYDVLGYPLEPLSQYYGHLVDDRTLKAGPFLAKYTPLSHLYYWTDNRFINQVAKNISHLI